MAHRRHACGTASCEVPWVTYSWSTNITLLLAFWRSERFVSRWPFYCSCSLCQAVHHQFLNLAQLWAAIDVESYDQGGSREESQVSTFSMMRWRISVRIIYFIWSKYRFRSSTNYYSAIQRYTNEFLAAAISTPPEGHPCQPWRRWASKVRRFSWLASLPSHLIMNTNSTHASSCGK